MSLISNPLFKTDNTEKLAVGDAYDISSTRPINKIFDAAKDGASKLFDRAGGINGIASGLQSIISAKMSGATGKQMLEAGLGMFNTSTIGILRDASNGILDRAGTFLDLDPSMIDRVKSAGSDVANRMQYGGFDDFTSYGSLTTLIGDMAGYPQLAEYVNMGMEAAVWGSAISQTIDYGQYHYMDDVKQYIDPEVYRQALIYSIPSVATSGELTAVTTLLGQLTAAEVYANKPDFVKVFLQRFKMPQTPPADFVAYSREVVNTCSQIQTGWYTYKRGAETIYDLTCLTTASEDAQRLLQLHPELGVIVQIAPEFPEQTVDENIHQQFPLMIMTLT